MNKLHSIEEVRHLAEVNQISMLLVKTTNCSVCDVVLLKLDKLIDSYKDVEFAYVYANEVPLVAGEFLVFTAPTIIIFVEGKEVFRQSRFIIFEEVTEILEKWGQFLKS